ncbi:MAG TPA: hypothetical protein VNA16_05000 [Abditibacteriaceae bacterium]|nr:hypothetical protein [Abditibacteriaceae bacterium]
MKIHIKSRNTYAALALLSLAPLAVRADEAAPAKAPFNYLWGKAYHIMPGTHNNESGYFSLVEGLDGKLYIGTAKYGENAYLVEFDPKTEKQRIVIDTNKLTGATGKGFAAQAKIHTKNFVGPSGKVYVGSKEGYPDAAEVKANDVAPYPGGYVMTYNPKTGKAENLGMPYPGQGINDVIADEARGLIYVITCENQYWMVYDTKAKQKKFRWLGPEMFHYASTIVDAGGRANAITKTFQMARWDPATNKLTQQDIMVGDKKLAPADPGRNDGWIPNWAVTPDKKTAYLVLMSHPELYKIDLTGDLDKPVTATMVGRMIDNNNTDCRSGVSIGPDGKVYVVLAVPNAGTFGSAAQLSHLTRYDPATNKVEDLGVIGVQNKDFFNFKGVDGKAPPFSHGFSTLPDGTLTPQYQHLGAITARDGTSYILFLYPYTLLRVPPIKS